MKRNILRRLLSAVLAVVMIAAVIPVSTMPIAAATGDQSGTCGDNLTWKFTASTGELRISGTGEMHIYGDTYNYVPWDHLDSYIKTVVVETGVTRITRYAFLNCVNLTDVELSDTVTVIDSEAFKNTGIISITLPDSVQSLGGYVFDDCVNLKSVYIGSGLMQIYETPFLNCTNLENIVVDELNTYYKSIDGNLYSKNGETMIRYAIGKKSTSFSIPEGVTVIGSEAFYGCATLQNINIPNSVELLCGNAFESTNITTLHIPKNVNEITYSAFVGCKYLSEITVDEGNETFKSIDGNLYNNKGRLLRYAPAKEADTFIIPNEVIEIGGGAFQYCYNLESIIISENVTLIGSHAFYECTNLTSIYFNATNCRDLTPTSQVFYAAGKDSTGITVTFAANVTRIPKYLFSIIDAKYTYKEKYRPNLKIVNIGIRVTEIGDEAFYFCSKVEQVNYVGTSEMWSEISVGHSNSGLNRVSVNIIECSNHTWHTVVTTKAPTCTSDGEYVITCTVCTTTHIAPIVATGHKYIDGICTCGDKKVVEIPENIEINEGAESEAVDEIIEDIKSNGALVGYKPHNIPENGKLEIIVSGIQVNDDIEKLVFDVVPQNKDGEKVSYFDKGKGITFRLPIPQSITKSHIRVYHDGKYFGTYVVKEANGAKYVEIYSENFSEYALEPVDISKEAYISVSSHTVVAGGRILVTVSLANNPGVTGMKLKISYNSDVLTLVNVHDKGLLGAAMHSNSFKSPYVLNWQNSTATTNYVANGAVVVLEFEVNEGAPLGEYPITVSYDLENDDIIDKDLNKVEFLAINGSVTVDDVILGDVNGDGKITQLDSFWLARHIAEWEGYEADKLNYAACDLNADGKVTQSDSFILARYIAEWEGYEELPYLR